MSSSNKRPLSGDGEPPAGTSVGSSTSRPKRLKKGEVDKVQPATQEEFDAILNKDSRSHLTKTELVKAKPFVSQELRDIIDEVVKHVGKVNLRGSDVSDYDALIGASDTMAIHESRLRSAIDFKGDATGNANDPIICKKVEDHIRRQISRVKDRARTNRKAEATLENEREKLHRRFKNGTDVSGEQKIWINVARTFLIDNFNETKEDQMEALCKKYPLHDGLDSVSLGFENYGVGEDDMKRI
jgi:hypothetical protein